MQNKTCDQCGRFVEDRGFSIRDFIEWSKDKVGKPYGNKDFCSLGCFVDWAIKNLKREEL